MARGQRDGFIFSEEKIHVAAVSRDFVCQKCRGGVKKKTTIFYFIKRLSYMNKVKKKTARKRKNEEKEKMITLKFL